MRENTHVSTRQTGRRCRDLIVVIPVYNEEKAVGSVLRDWCGTLDALHVDYLIAVYNDGSTDGSLRVVRAFAETADGRVMVADKPNEGHGPTILRGYGEAVDAGCDWIFQVDSDDELGSAQFKLLWEARDKFDLLAGRRIGRQQTGSRKLVSAVSRLAVRIFFGKTIWDVNVPYRLMRTEAFSGIIRAIPPDTFAPNVILSGMVARRRLRFQEVDVAQRPRRAGTSSLARLKLLASAFRSFRQTIAFAIRH